MTAERKLPPAGLARDLLAEEESQNNYQQVVTFALGEEYGLPIVQVQEIIRLGSITRVPNAPHYMEGVINLRGKVLPVLNLRKRLRLDDAPYTSRSRIVVTELGGKLLGLLVDSVSHVIRVPLERMESTPEEVLEVDTNYISGVCKLEDRFIILLDLVKLLDKENLDAIESGGSASITRGIPER